MDYWQGMMPSTYAEALRDFNSLLQAGYLEKGDREAFIDRALQDAKELAREWA